MSGRLAGAAGPLVGALLVLCDVGCATSYRPAPSPRIGVIVRQGVAWYVKDGGETPIGPLGGDLQTLVAAEPDAVRFARRARHQLAVGVPAYVCGVGAAVIGLLVVSKPAGWFVGGGGAATAGVGLGLMSAGAMNTVDAINVYNDRVAGAAP